MLLVLVHSDNLTPICCHFWKMETFRKIYEVEDIFLETRTTESDRSAQKFGPNSRVFSDRMSDFLDVGSRRLANGGQRIDGRYTLGQHRVGREFRQFGRPEADGQDAISPVIEAK